MPVPQEWRYRVEELAGPYCLKMLTIALAENFADEVSEKFEDSLL